MGTTYKKKSKAKPTKVTESELKTIQGFVQQMNKTQMDIGGLAFQQSLGIKRLNSLQEQLTEYNVGLQKIYGNVSVNIVDGTLNEGKDGPVDKKN